MNGCMHLCQSISSLVGKYGRSPSMKGLSCPLPRWGKRGIEVTIGLTERNTKERVEGEGKCSSFSLSNQRRYSWMCIELENRRDHGSETKREWEREMIPDVERELADCSDLFFSLSVIPFVSIFPSGLSLSLFNLCLLIHELSLSLWIDYWDESEWPPDRETSPNVRERMKGKAIETPSSFPPETILLIGPSPFCILSLSPLRWKEKDFHSQSKCSQRLKVKEASLFSSIRTPFRPPSSHSLIWEGKGEGRQTKWVRRGRRMEVNIWCNPFILLLLLQSTLSLLSSLLISLDDLPHFILQSV